MKTPKRINSKRPSLWMTKNCELKIYHPNARIESFSMNGGWYDSVDFRINHRIDEIAYLMGVYTVLGYL